MTSVILEEATPRGRLRVERYDDPSFPGFTLYLDDHQVGIFEYDSVKNCVFLRIWTEDTEDPAMTLPLDAGAHSL